MVTTVYNYHPFRTFREWDSEADARAYGDL